jgi:hypothetical protein
MTECKALTGGKKKTSPKKLVRKYTCKDGTKKTLYKKGDKYLVKKKTPSGKFTWREVHP